MTDHQLSTRDLAARSDSDDRDDSVEKQEPTAANAGLTPSDQESGAESSGSDASLTRDPATGDPGPADVQATEPDGKPLGSDPGESRTSAAGNEHQPLFPNDQSERFTSRWQEIQISFVDQPRDAVAEADALVADLMQRLAASFSQERERLEAQWDRGDDVSTEDLRVALTRYRSFFDRLLSA